MNTHNIPDRLHDMRVYNNASNVMLGISKVTLPDMDYLTETMKGAGIAGEFESIAPGLLKALELGLDFNTVTKHTYSLFAPTSHYIDCRMAVNNVDGGDGSPKSEGWRVVAKGVTKSFKQGNAEPSTQMGTSVTLSLTYIKVTNQGKTMMEIDVINYICKVGEVDYLADIRSLLGM